MKESRLSVATDGFHERAVDVWSRLAESTDRPSDHKISMAFKELEDQSEGLFNRLLNGPPRCSLRIVFTRVRRPYSSDQEMISAVRRTRVLEIATVSGDRERPHPMMDTALGGSYDKFRAVHDAIGHIATGLGFETHEEIAAWKTQDKWYRGLARLALCTELYGETCVRWISGHPAPHRAALLDQCLIQKALGAYDTLERNQPSVLPADGRLCACQSESWSCRRASERFGR